MGRLFGDEWGPKLEQMGMTWAGQGPAYMAAHARQQEAGILKDEGRRDAMLKDILAVGYHLDNNNPGAAEALLQNRIDYINKLGGDPTQSQGLVRMLQEGRHEEVRKGVAGIRARHVAMGDLKAANDKGSQFGRDRLWQDEENNYYQSTMVNDPNTGKSRTSRVPMFGAPDEPVGKVVPVSDLGQTPGQIVKHKAAVAAATETSGTTARLETEFKLKPKVEVAVREAVSNFERSFDREGEAYENSAVLQTYDAAMGGLMKSLGATTTGSVVGWLPAMTENSQIATGAIAAMAPVLKQMFRSSGEGTFTDSDQKLLMEMIPTRKDGPGARVAKVANIDAIVRAKLKQPARTSKAAPYNAKGWRLMQDASGAQAYVGPNGEVEEAQ